MTKGEQVGKGEKRSKYFSIDSYFKNPVVNNNKKVKLSTSFEQQVEEAIELSLKKPEVELTKLKKEQCPLCHAFIFIESVSMEVHVNGCLDSQQQTEDMNKINTIPNLKDTFACFKDTTTTKETTDPSSKENTRKTSSASSSSKENISGSSRENMDIACKENISISSSSSKENVIPPLVKEGVIRRILPSAWKSLFSASDTPVALPLDIKNVNTTMKTNKKKSCPFYKRMRDTRFVVDAFNYGKISDCDGYFLTHYHSDHYGGLRKSWSHGPIYCSQVTANLVKQELGVNPYYIKPLPMNEYYAIQGTNITVGLIDANHCPGSVLFLFIIQHSDGTKTRHLHTGDFRASPRMCLHPFIQQPENGPIHSLYLDTTYLNPQYSFPAQEECIKSVCDLVKKELRTRQVIEKVSLLDTWISKAKNDDPMIQASESRVLIVVGTYTIGKERVFINIARMLKCKIYAPYKKKRILRCQRDSELDSMLTDNPFEAQVHVVSLRDIRVDIMSKYLDDHKSHFDSLIAFKPTGWTYKSSKIETSDMILAPLSHIITPPIDRSLYLTPYYDRNNLKFYGVPYSEHSSFRELASFIASLDIQHIIPTVNLHKLDDMSIYFKKWQEEKLSKRIEVVSFTTKEHW